MAMTARWPSSHLVSKRFNQLIDSNIYSDVSMCKPKTPRLFCRIGGGPYFAVLNVPPWGLVETVMKFRSSQTSIGASLEHSFAQELMVGTWRPS